MKGTLSKAREILASQILLDFKDEIAGNHMERVVGINPEDKIFVGKLMSIDEDSDSQISNKTYIQSISVDFYIRNDEIDSAVVNIMPQGDFYYRVYPTLNEQREEILTETYKLMDKEYSDFNELLKDYNISKEEFKNIDAKLVPVYKKIRIQKNNYSMHIKLSDIINKSIGFGYIDEKSKENIEFNEYIGNIQEGVSSDNERYAFDIYEKTKIKDLIDEKSYEKFINNNAKKEVKINQNWSLYIQISAKRLKDNYLISVSLVNNSQLFSNTRLKKSNNKPTIETLFNSGLQIQLENALYEKIILDYFLDDYKYDRTQEAVGTNCTVSFIKDKNMIITDHMPTYKQNRLLTNDKLAVNFNDLIEKPIEILKDIKHKMDKELLKWEEYKNDIYNSLTDKAKEKITKEIKEFENEIKRFNKGIVVLDNYPIALKSFVLMNETFLESSKNYSTWRLFQIVFIVSIVPDIVACDENIMPDDEKENTDLESMALLYFPTGGGKTEAFLGILVFNLFFDRFRGKWCGVTSILRYPLRLLSVQQVQRLANILAQAELIRRNQNEIVNTDSFSLGYFVGDSNTPNRISKTDVDKYKTMTQEQLDEYRVIDICPFCGKETVHLDFDDNSHRLIHYCSSDECKSGNVLPLYIVDNEIYRYLPSAIISTVDKLAIMGNNRNFRNIMNGCNRRCPKHGFTSTNKCVESYCDIEVGNYEEIDMYDPAPSLLIQDELHLINESLGAYASHYETFMQYYIKEISKSKRGVKVIGATATISSYESQVYHLYKKHAIRFPVASPFQDRNFYSYIDHNDIQRLIMGYAPFGKAIVNSVVYSLKYMRKVVYNYLSDPQKVLFIKDIGISKIEDALKILEDYWIFLEYNNVKRDGNNVEGALETPINVELQAEGIKPFITRKMTGDESFQDVRNVLSEVENTENVFDGVNLIAATSMISHGVDADRFNVMFFYGIPGNTAEYIQAYSRTGRKHSSIVVDIIRPSRETDLSYLKNFIKFHEYKDIMIEAVPINRWATKAIDNTLPGVFTSFLLCVFDIELQYTCGNLFYMKNIKKAITKGLLNKDDFKNKLKLSYSCINEGMYDDLGNQYRIKIDDFVDTVFERISDKEWLDENIFTGFKLMGYRIMNSLRDTDTQLILELE